MLDDPRTEPDLTGSTEERVQPVKWIQPTFDLPGQKERECNAGWGPK